MSQRISFSKCFPVEKPGLFQKSRGAGVCERGGQFRSAKFVADCASNLRQTAGSSCRTSEEGCVRFSQICREFETQFLKKDLSRNWGKTCLTEEFGVWGDLCGTSEVIE